MPIALTDPDCANCRRQADQAAVRLVRRYRLPAEDRDDLRHDLLLDLLTRLKDYDPQRGTVPAFASTVIAHAATRLAGRLRRDQSVFAPVSLDDPFGDDSGVTVGSRMANEDSYASQMWAPMSAIAHLETRLSLDRALAGLSSPQIRFCSHLVDGWQAVVAAPDAPSRATLYRQRTSVRLDLIMAGVSAGTAPRLGSGQAVRS